MLPMLKIRLQRVGRKAEPTFRLVLTDSKNSTKSGKYLEVLGNYDSRRGEKSEFKGDRVTYWMSKGAQVTPTVHNLLISKKVITGKKVNVLPLKKAIKKDVVEEPKTEAPAAAEVSTPAEVVEEAPAPEVADTPAPAEEVTAEAPTE
jgi:small subunit ribosomal protein S16